MAVTESSLNIKTGGCMREKLMKKCFKVNLRYQAPLLISILIIIFLLLLPTGYEEALNYQGTERCKAEVLSIDDGNIIDTGLVRSGEQRCVLEFDSGRFKGHTAEGINQLTGSLESDKLFAVGDTALVTIDYQGDEIGYVMMVDHYRVNKEIILAALFAAFLILFAGKTGVRAIISFAVTILMLWKVLIPCYLKGYNPIMIGILITITLTILIISLVYGFEKRSVSAILGATLGVATTCILGMIFTNLFKVHGAIMTNSESLLYAGYQNLNLTQIFMASIFIGSSGAMMDLAVDITSAVYEVVTQCPGIKTKAAIRSGINVGRAAMGTMTTTLLLAYSGGYIALLMVFMAQGTPISHILNYKYVSAEILETIVGSFGLITVAPFTALSAGWILTRRKPIRGKH
jgi:uncharacterized membrane protein